METQLTLAMMNDELGQARTSKKEFLDKIESIVPWDTFIGIIAPCYYKGERGNKPYPLELMLRIFLLLGCLRFFLITIYAVLPILYISFR